MIPTKQLSPHYSEFYDRIKMIMSTFETYTELDDGEKVEPKIIHRMQGWALKQIDEILKEYK